MILIKLSIRIQFKYTINIYIIILLYKWLTIQRFFFILKTENFFIFLNGVAVKSCDYEQGWCKAHLKSFNFSALKLRVALLCLGLGLAQLIKPLSGCPNPHFHSHRNAAAVNPFPLALTKSSARVCPKVPFLRAQTQFLFTSAANRPRGSSTFVVRVGAFCQLESQVREVRALVPQQFWSVMALISACMI